MFKQAVFLLADEISVQHFPRPRGIRGLSPYLGSVEGSEQARETGTDVSESVWWQGPRGGAQNLQSCAEAQHSSAQGWSTDHGPHSGSEYRCPGRAPRLMGQTHDLKVAQAPCLLPSPLDPGGPEGRIG